MKLMVLASVLLSGCALIDALGGSGGDDIAGDGAPPANPLGKVDAYPTPFFAPEIALGDWNGDGRMDIVGANNINPGAITLLGQPDGTFVPGPNVNVGPCRAIAVADFDNNGRDDIACVAGCTDTNQIEIAFANDAGAFDTSPTKLALEACPTGAVAGNLDGVGLPDLATLSEELDNVPIFTQGVAPGFTAVAPPAVDGANTLAIGKVDADAIPDLVVAFSNVTEQGFRVLAGGPSLGQQIGSFGISAKLLAIAVADLDADTHGDVVYAMDCFGCTHLGIAFGNGVGGFDDAGTQVGDAVGRLAVGNFDRTGLLDFAGAAPPPNGGTPAPFDLQIQPVNSRTSFGPTLTGEVGDLPNGIVAHDFDGDGDDDIAVTHANNQAGAIVVVLVDL